ncbi:MAG: hypothetical protein AB1529_00225 [Candidatus Micrarchaeota archaeon]
MGSLRDERKKKLAAGAVKGPASQPPPKLGAGLVEPPARRAEEPVSPAAPVEEAPASVPEPEPAPVSSPASAAGRAAKALVVAAESGVDVSEAIPALADALAEKSPAKEPSVPVDVSSGSAVILEEEEPAAPAGKSPPPPPQVAEPSPLGSLAVEEEEPPKPIVVEEAQRKVHGVVAFDDEGDDAMLPSRYKLNFQGMEGANKCKFVLVGKSIKEVSLELGVPKTVTVDSSGGMMSVTLTYQGANAQGKKEVEYTVEGGVAAVTQALEKTRKAGSAVRSKLSRFIDHLPEVFVGAFGAALAVCGATMDWIKSSTLNTVIVVSAVAVIGVLAVWTGIERMLHRNAQERGA